MLLAPRISSPHQLLGPLVPTALWCLGPHVVASACPVTIGTSSIPIAMLPLGPGNLVALAALRFLPPLRFCPFKSSAAAWISWFLFLVAPCHFMASAPVLVHCCLGALWLRLWQPMMTKVSHDPCHHRISAASSLLSPLFLITAHPLLPYEILFICSFLPRHPSSLKGSLLHLIVSCTCSLTMCSMRWDSYANPSNRLCWPAQRIGHPWVR